MAINKKKSKQIKKLLVCGGLGFIGSNFIRNILNRYPNWQILNLDKITYSGNKDNLKDIEKNSRYFFKKGDICNQRTINDIFLEFKPDYVINFAAETHVDRSIHVGALEFIQTNVRGVFSILEAIKKSKFVLKYVQVSTDEVYGELPLDRPDLKFKETSPFNPSIPYSATKASGDLLCYSYFKTWKLPVVVTHCSNNYGPYQYPEKLIPYFILRMLENKKLPIYGDGKNVRDWIYVDDHCYALELCLLNGVDGETYNIGADNEISNYEIAKKILNYFNKDESQIIYVKDRPGHDSRYAIDALKIKRDLKWYPQYTFNQAFNSTLNWYVNNKEWINKVRKRTGVFNPHIDLWEGHK